MVILRKQKLLPFKMPLTWRSAVTQSNILVALEIDFGYNRIRASSPDTAQRLAGFFHPDVITGNSQLAEM